MGHKYLDKNVEFQLSRNHLEHHSNHWEQPNNFLVTTQNALQNPSNQSEQLY